MFRKPVRVPTLPLAAYVHVWVIVPLSGFIAVSKRDFDPCGPACPSLDYWLDGEADRPAIKPAPCDPKRTQDRWHSGAAAKWQKGTGRKNHSMLEM